MFRTSTTVSAAVLLAGATVATVALGAAPASAATDTTAPAIVSTSIAQTELVIPAHGLSEKVRFSVRATDAVGVTNVVVAVFHKGRIVTVPTGQPLIFPMTRVSGDAHDGVWTSWVRQEASTEPGSYTLRAVAEDKAQNTSPTTKIGTYQARDNTRLSLNIADRSVTANQPVELSGQLRRASKSGWAGFAGRRLLVLFRPAGSNVWQRVGKVYTNASGHYSQAFTTTLSGSFRVAYAGDAKDVAAVSPARKVTLG